MLFFLSLIGASVALTLVSALLLSRMYRVSEAGWQATLDATRAAGPPHFFDAQSSRRRPAVPDVPLELLLLQIDQHIRVEREAAESFHLYPTVAALHTHSASPLVH